MRRLERVARKDCVSHDSINGGDLSFPEKSCLINEQAMLNYKEREQNRKKVFSMYCSGVPKVNILKAVPISRRTLYRWLDEYTSQKRIPKEYRSEKQKKYYDEVIRLHFEQGYGEDTISRFIPVGHSTIGRWIATFVSENGKISLPRVMKKYQKESSPQALSSDVESLQKRVKDLEKQLLQAELKAEFYDEMITVAEAKFKIPIRKKAGAKQ